MDSIVVDASVVLAWGLPDENNTYADAVLSAVERSGMHVPALWAFEVANGLAISAQGRRITADDQHEFLSELARLKIIVDPLDVHGTIRKSIVIAGQYGLTAYDAAYVDLASRTGLVLATLDARMENAARDAGLTIFQV